MIRLKFYLICVFIFGNVIWAQEKRINGKVQSEGIPLNEIEVVNSRNKTTTKTNKKGEFSILAKNNDELIALTKDYLIKKIIVTEKDFSSNNLIIEMPKMAIELKEVEVKKEAELNADVNLDALKTVELEKTQARPKPIGVYTGEIPNGIDFVKVGEKIMLLFKGENQRVPKKEAVVEFRNYIERNFSTDFFVNKLNLNEKEIPFFIDFCSKDFASTQIPKSNELDVIEFLIQKRKEYKK
ncbi:hypothetical protein [Flavobacterium sp. H122]|uniref:hypothetical protein n=1 Tax=Flavobacterium sp. H122 TaxID=2529860 RepID=UPI0010AB1897|nr:hypothetical protein [Flavobacterium sp. H122]